MQSAEVRSSSVSDAIDTLRAALDDEATEITQEDLSSLLAVAARLFADRSVDPYRDATLAGLDMTATEACTVAVALLRAQSLTPFDLSIWFASTNLERN